MEKGDGGPTAEEIDAVSASIQRVCNLIPIPHWGFDGEVMEKFNNRKKSIVNQHLSESDRNSLSAESKNRVARAAGFGSRTVSDVLDWMAKSSLQKLEELPKLKPKPVQQKKQQNGKTEDSEDEENDEPAAPVTPVKKQKQEKQRQNPSRKPSKRPPPETPTTAAVTPKRPKTDANRQQNGTTNEENPIEARQAALRRLHEKIEDYKTKRRGAMTAEDWEAKRKLKRRIGKLKAKESKRVAKEGGANNAQSKQEKAKVDVEAKPVETPKLENGQVAYSKFDFIMKKEEEKKTSKNEKRDKFVGRDYARLLKKAEQREERLESIREKNPEKAAHIEENIKWNKVLHLAEGQKVKDDVELLRKSAKRKEMLKEKRKSKWDKRTSQVDKKKHRRQEKRETNIQKRKDTVKKKKLERARKKGRIL